MYVIGEFKIGNTIAKTVNEDFINLEVIFSGLIAAIFWNLLTWWFGIPSSSSHTLIGGFLGAALMHALVLDYHHVALANPDFSIIEKLKLAFQQLFTQSVVKYDKVIPIFLFIFLAPVIGMIISVIILSLIHISSGGAQGVASDMEINLREMLKLKKELYDIIAHHSGQTYEWVEKASDRDYWMTSTEAKDFGMVDEVLERKIEK